MCIRDSLGFVPLFRDGGGDFAEFLVQVLGLGGSLDGDLGTGLGGCEGLIDSVGRYYYRG